MDHFLHFECADLFFGPEKWILNPISFTFPTMKKLHVVLDNYDAKGNVLAVGTNAWAWGLKRG